MDKKNNFAVAFSLALCLFSVFTGIGLINAVLVDLSIDFNTSVAVMGQLSTVAAVSWAVFALLIGPFSDKVGHKNMVIIGMIIFVFSLILFGMSRSLFVLLLAGMLSGLSGAFAGPNILTAVGDYFPAHIVGVMLAVVTVSTPLANLIGVPLLVFINGLFDWRLSFFVLAIVSFISILPLLFIHDPTVSAHKQSNPSISYLSCYFDAFKNRLFVVIILANTLLQVAYWLIATYFAAFLVYNYSINANQLAAYLSFMAIGQLVGTLAGGPLADTYDRLKIGLFFSFLLGLSGLFFAVITSNAVLTILLGAIIMGNYAIGRPAFFAVMLNTSETNRGTIMGIQATSNHVGRALGAAAGGLILSISTYTIIGIVCLVTGIITALLYLIVLKK